MQKLHSIPCLLLAAVLLAGCGAQETAQDSQPSAESVRTSMREDYTTAELVSDMGLGINLGNTLEACGDWIQGDSVTSYETAWGSPVVTEEMIAGYAKAGFQTVRIPVAWSNLMAEDYTIAPELLERVETVVQYVLDNDMYAIVNLHWDGGWIAGFSTDFDTCMEKYTRIWEPSTRRAALTTCGTATAVRIPARRRHTALSTISTRLSWIWCAIPAETMPGGICSSPVMPPMWI